MNRRFLLAGSSVFALAACGVEGFAPTLLQTDSELVANLIAADAIILEQAVPPSDIALLQEIEDAALAAGKDATTLGALVVPANADDLIAAIVGVITTYDGLIATFLPGSQKTINELNAALVLAQALYADANLPPPITRVGSKVGIRPKLGVPVMPLDLARATLSHVHQRGADLR